MPAMQGLTMKSIKKHPALIPLYLCLFAGGAAVVASTGRCALKNPDVSWDKKNNPEPWQKYSDKRYPLLDPAGARGWTDVPTQIRSIWF